MNTNAILSVLRATLKRLDVELPGAVAQALSDRDTLIDAANKTKPVTETQVVGAWAEAMLSGRDPLTDPDVQRLATAQALGGSIAHNVGQTAEARVVDALKANTTTILTALKTKADTAGTSLTAAYTVLGDTPLEDQATVVRAGSKALAAWESATLAVKVIQDVDLAWKQLNELTRFAPMTEHAVRLAALDLHTFEQTRRRLDPWAVVRAGFTIDYAIDTATINARIALHQQEREDRNAAAQAAWKKQTQQSRGFAVVSPY